MYEPTIQTAPPSPEHTTPPTEEARELPELYVRANATKNSKGINVDKTISVRGRISPEELTFLLGQVSAIADVQLEEEKKKLLAE